MPIREDIGATTAQTWGMTEESRTWIGGNNVDARRAIELIVGSAPRPPTGELDRAFIAPSSVDEAIYFARKLRGRLAPDASVWVVYPKRGSPREAEFSGAFEEMVIALFELGFAETGRANLTGDYTSTGFKPDSL